MGGEKRGREEKAEEGRGRSFHVKLKASVWLLIDDFCPLEV